MRYLLLIILLSGCGSRTASDQQAALRFQEKYRPQVHFSPALNWMNDPNGLVYFDGEYHFFYQHNTEAPVWGPMHWGHAVSRDLIHWEHLPVALYPDSLGTIFSGSAVADLDNTSGFGTTDHPPLVAVFTYHNHDIEKRGGIDVETQGIAYSLDKGRTWTKYDRNPVVGNPGIRDFRDPKVIWHKPSERWVMVLAAGDRVRFYTSANLREWTYTGDFGEGRGAKGVWECPDLFELPVSGSDESRWVLTVNIGPGPNGAPATEYFTGNFDGTVFTSSQSKTLWMDYGKDDYAGVTFDNMPDGRRVLMGWMNSWEYAAVTPTVTWSGAATIPRVLGLVKAHNDYLLTSRPVAELEKLYGKRADIPAFDAEGTVDITRKIPFPLLPADLRIRFNTANRTQMGFAEKFGIVLSNEQDEFIRIGYDNFDKVFYVDRTNAAGKTFSDAYAGVHLLPYEVDEQEVDIRIIFDVASLEMFAMDGKAVMTETFFPATGFNRIGIFSENGKISVTGFSVIQLKSIWE